MNLNYDVVYRCRRLGPLHQLHPGRSRSLVRHHDRLHDNFLLGHLSLWWKCCSVGRITFSILPHVDTFCSIPLLPAVPPCASSPSRRLERLVVAHSGFRVVLLHALHATTAASRQGTRTRRIARIAALRDFKPAYDRSGSIASDQESP